MKRIPPWRPFLFIFVLLALAGPLAAQEHYLPSSGLDVIALLAPPPETNSEEQAADLQMSRAVVKARSQAETARARVDMTLSPFSFQDAIGPFFQPGQFPKTEALLAKVKKEIHDPIYGAKNHWGRLRPYQVDASLSFDRPEEGFSYPSGHSTVGTVDALILSELFPDKKEAILAQGRQIGWDRVLTGYHYLTDVRAGRVLGQALMRELLANPNFQRDLAQARTEATANRPH